MSINKRALLLLAASLAIIVAGLSLNFLYTYRRYARMQEQMALWGVAEYSVTLGEFDKKMLSDALNVGQILVDQYEKGIWRTAEDAVPLLGAIHRSLTSLENGRLVLAGTADRMMALSTSLAPRPDLDPQKLPWREQLAGAKEPFIAGIQADLLSGGAPLYAAVAPLFGNLGEAIGTLVVEVSADELDIARMSDRQAGGYVTFLLSRNDSFMLTIDGEDIRTEKIAPNPSDVRDMTTLLRTAEKQGTGMEEILFGGEEFKVFYHIPPPGGMAVAHAYRKDGLTLDALRSARGLAMKNALLALLFFLLILPFLLFLSKAMKRLIETSEIIQDTLAHVVEDQNATSGKKPMAGEFFVMLSLLDRKEREVDIVEFEDLIVAVKESLSVISSQHSVVSLYAEHTGQLNAKLTEVNNTLKERETLWRSVLDMSNLFTDTGAVENYGAVADYVCNTLLIVLGADSVRLACVRHEGRGDLDVISHIYGEGHDAAEGGLSSPEVHRLKIPETRIAWVENVRTCAGVVPASPKVVTQLEVQVLHMRRLMGALSIGFSEHIVPDQAIEDTIMPVVITLGAYMSIFAHQREVRQSYHYLAEKLLSITGNYHNETDEHLRRIADISRMAAHWLGRSPEEQEDIRFFSRLYDIGKLRVPKELLLKPSILLEDEMEVIRKHSLYGAELVGESDWLSMAREICLYHHEKWDGSGYPFGLKGEEIPWTAQVVALADIYDALRTFRPYKHPLGHRESCRIILEGDGRVRPHHFNPHILDFFTKNHMRIADLYDGED